MNGITDWAQRKPLLRYYCDSGTVLEKVVTRPTWHWRDRLITPPPHLHPLLQEEHTDRKALMLTWSGALACCSRNRMAACRFHFSSSQAETLKAVSSAEKKKNEKSQLIMASFVMQKQLLYMRNLSGSVRTDSKEGWRCQVAFKNVRSSKSKRDYNNLKDLNFTTMATTQWNQLHWHSDIFVRAGKSILYHTYFVFWLRTEHAVKISLAGGVGTQTERVINHIFPWDWHFVAAAKTWLHRRGKRQGKYNWEKAFI